VESNRVYHVYDRGNDRRTLFESPEDYDLFLALLADARAGSGTEVLAFCAMPNHWHLLLRPLTDVGLHKFVSRLKQIHTRRWHSKHESAGTGHLYQGRFRARLLETSEAEAACCRYVERNALSAGLVARAEDWKWGSLWHRVRGDPRGLLSLMPEPLPEEWVGNVNAE
jgi:putative transposase